MKILLLVALAVPLAACDHGGSSSSGSASAPAKTSAPASTVKKKVTKAEIDEAKGLAKPFAPWSEANAAVTDKLGAAHGTDGDKYLWTAVEGDKCAQLSVEKKGDEVGSVGVSEYDKAMQSAFDKCAATAPK